MDCSVTACTRSISTQRKNMHASRCMLHDSMHKVTPPPPLPPFLASPESVLTSR